MRWIDIIGENIIDFSELSHLKLPGSLQRLLTGQGYKLLGYGAGGAAFAKLGDSNIIKVGKLTDSWWDWANWCQKQNFDCVPKIKSVRKYNEQVYMVVMEKLSPVKSNFVSNPIWKSYCAWMTVKTGDDTYKEMYLRKVADDEIEKLSLEFEQNHVCLVEVLKQILDKFSEHALDLYGPENFMLRGNTLVINDPISRKK